MLLIDQQEILNKCKKNDRQAQVVLYNWLAPKLLGLCVRYFADRSEAEDVMQDSFVKIFMNLDAYRFEGSFEGWCKRIAVNTALNRLKQNNRIQFARNFDLAQNTEWTAGEVTELDTQELLNCLDELPNGYRTILNLFLFEDFSHREIAEKLGISESTSRSQFTRAKQLLARLLKIRMQSNQSKFAG